MTLTFEETLRLIGRLEKLTAEFDALLSDGSGRNRPPVYPDPLPHEKEESK